MIDGPSVDRHHWIPRSEGGGGAVPLHRVCHRMIHRVFSETELSAVYQTPEALRGHPEIARFIAWVRRKPPSYVDWPRKPKRERKSGAR